MILTPSLVQGFAINKRLTRKYDVLHTGVTTDNFTPSGAVIMVATVLLYAIVQVLHLAESLQTCPLCTILSACIMSRQAACVPELCMSEISDHVMSTERSLHT